MTQDDHKGARSPLEWKALQTVTFPKGSPADQKRNKLKTDLSSKGQPLLRSYSYDFGYLRRPESGYPLKYKKKKKKSWPVVFPHLTPLCSQGRGQGCQIGRGIWANLATLERGAQLQRA